MISTPKACCVAACYAVFAASRSRWRQSLLHRLGYPSPSATAASGSLRGQRARQDHRLGGHVDGHLPRLASRNQPGADDHLSAAGGPQSLGALKTYFDANPQVGKDMQQLQQPLVNLSTRCKLPISLPQLMGLMQAAQQQGGALPGGLPGALQTCADRRRSRRRAARFAVTCIGRHAGQRTASRTWRPPPPLAPGDARSVHGDLSCSFGLSHDWLIARQESQHPFCLAFNCRNR